jgi:hypothetical protein
MHGARGGAPEGKPGTKANGFNTFAAMRRASSRVKSLAAERRPGSSSK